MPTNRYQRFSDALAEAARAQIGTEQQAAIAHELGLSASYVSKLLSGNHRPSTRVLASIASKFGEDLAELVDPASVRPRIYVASPVTALDGSDIEANRKDVRRIVDSLEAQGIDCVWPGHHVDDRNDYLPPSVEAERNLTELSSCTGFLYFQSHEVIGGSGSLVEVGLAMGIGLPCIIFLGSNLSRVAYLLDGAQTETSLLRHAPRVRTHKIDSASTAVGMIDRHGWSLWQPNSE